MTVYTIYTVITKVKKAQFLTGPCLLPSIPGIELLLYFIRRMTVAHPLHALHLPYPPSRPPHAFIAGGFSWRIINSLLVFPLLHCFILDIDHSFLYVNLAVCDDSVRVAHPARQCSTLSPAPPSLLLLGSWRFMKTGYIWG